MAQFTYALRIDVLEKASKKKAPKPKLGYADGLPVIAIGPKGGKIVGYRFGKPVYAGSKAAKKLAAQKKAAKGKKAPGKKTSTAHRKAVLEWLQTLELDSHAALAPNEVKVSQEGAQELQKVFGVQGVPQGGMIKLKVEDLWPHVGEPLTPPAEEEVATAAKLTAHDYRDAPFPEKVLDTLEVTGALGGSHGGKVAKDASGNKYAWKVNGGEKHISRAEETFNRVAALVMPNPNLYPKAEMMTFKGKEGVLLEWKDNQGTFGKEFGTPDPAKYQEHFGDIVRHHVLDWMMSNHDSHGENFLVSKDGLVAIDKGQAFKWVGKPHKEGDLKSGEVGSPNNSNPVYVHFWNLVKQGKIKGDPVTAVTQVIHGIEKNLSLEQYQTLMGPYLEELAAAGKPAQSIWAQAKKRFESMRSDFEGFLSARLGKDVKIPPLPVENFETMPETPVEDKQGNVVDSFQKPGWPVKKGSVTVHNPGQAPASGIKWPGKYPGPGYMATIAYKGQDYAFEFGVSGLGKMEVTVTLPDGKMLSYGSPQGAADALLLYDKGLPLDMSSTDKKKNKIAYTATKLFKLKEFQKEFEAAASADPIPVADTKKKLQEEKLTSMDAKVITQATILSSFAGAVVTDPGMLPVEVQEFANAYGSASLPSGWPDEHPPPGTVLKYPPTAKPGKPVHLFAAKEAASGGSVYSHWKVTEVDGKTVVQEAPQVTGDVSGALAAAVHSPEAKAAWQVAEASKVPPPPPPAPKAEVIPDKVKDVEVPASAPKHFNGPLPPGHKHKVKKKGVGWVALMVTDDGKFQVQMEPGPNELTVETTVWDSLSAASDHVWVKQKGFKDAAEYKQQTGKNKVPSGGGWKFWGLKPGQKVEAAPTPVPAPAAEPELPWTGQKKATPEELASLPVSTWLVDKDGDSWLKVGPDLWDMPNNDEWGEPTASAHMHGHGPYKIDELGDGPTPAPAKVEGAHPTAPTNLDNLVDVKQPAISGEWLKDAPVGSVITGMSGKPTTVHKTKFTYEKTGPDTWKWGANPADTKTSGELAVTFSFSSPDDNPAFFSSAGTKAYTADEANNFQTMPEGKPDKAALEAAAAGSVVQMVESDGEEVAYTKQAGGMWHGTDGEKVSDAGMNAAVQGSSSASLQTAFTPEKLKVGDIEFPMNASATDKDGNVWTLTAENTWSGPGGETKTTAELKEIHETEENPAINWTSMKDVPDVEALNALPPGSVVADPIFSNTQAHIYEKNDAGIWIRAVNGKGYESSDIIIPDSPLKLVWEGEATPLPQVGDKGALSISELDALPVGSTILGFGEIFQKQPTGMWFNEDGEDFAPSDMAGEEYKVVSHGTGVEPATPPAGPAPTGWEGTKKLTTEELEAYPVGTVVEEDGGDYGTYVKTADDTWKTIGYASATWGVATTPLKLKSIGVPGAEHIDAKGTPKSGMKEALDAAEIGSQVVLHDPDDDEVSGTFTKVGPNEWTKTWFTGATSEAQYTTDSVAHSSTVFTGSQDSVHVISSKGPVAAAPGVPAKGAELAWNGFNVPTAEQLKELPLGSIIENQTGGQLAKESSDTWITAGNIGLSMADLITSIESGKTKYGIKEQPGAYGWAGSKAVSKHELEHFPEGTKVHTVDETYVKNADGNWDTFEDEDALTGTYDHAQIAGQQSVLELPEGWTPSSQMPKAKSPAVPVEAPGAPAQPSIAGVKPAKVVVTKEDIPDFAKKDKLWETAEVLSTKAVPNGPPGVTHGMKSPSWPGWVPPTGVWIQGEINGQKVWFTTFVAGWTTDGKSEQGVRFAVVDANGEFATTDYADGFGNAHDALENALGKIGFNYMDEEAQVSSFNLGAAAFDGKETFQTVKDAPHADEVITTSPGEQTNAQTGQVVKTTVTVEELIKQESVQKEFGGKFYVSQPKSAKAKAKYAGGVYVKFYPDDGGSAGNAGDKLKEFIQKYGLEGAQIKDPTYYAGEKNSWMVLKEDALQKEQVVETTVPEAAQVPPSKPAPTKDTGWPWGTTVKTVPMFSSAPEGATVWTDNGTLWKKGSDGLWHITSTENGVSQEYGYGHLEMANLPNVLADSGYIAPDDKPWWGDYDHVPKTDLDAMPVGQVLHSDGAGGIKLTKVDALTWKGNDGKSYGPHAVSSSFNHVIEPHDAAKYKKPAKPAKKIKKISTVWKLQTVRKKIKELPVGAIITLPDGKQATKTEQKGSNNFHFWTINDEFGGQDLVLGATIAVKAYKDGAHVTWPGDKPPKPKLATGSPKPKAKPKAELTAEQKAQIEGAKKFQAWGKDHPKASDPKHMLMLAHIQKGLGLQETGFHAHVSGDALILGGPDAAAFKKSVDNWATMPPYEEVDSPLGKMLKFDFEALKKAIPAGTFFVGQDGSPHPHGTTFEETEVPTKTFLDQFNEDTQNPGPPGSPKKYKPHNTDSDKIVIKFNGSDEQAQQAAAAYVKTNGLEPTGGPHVKENIVYEFQKSIMDKVLETKTEVQAKEPKPPKGFKQMPSPFKVGTQDYGEIAQNNESDLEVLDTIKGGLWGHAVRHGKAGLWRDTQVSVKRIKGKDGEEYYEVHGELLDFDHKKTKLAEKSGVGMAYNYTSGKYYPYDEETGLHDEGDTALGNSWSGFQGTTADGVEVTVVHDGNSWNSSGYSGNDDVGMRNRFVARIPVGQDVRSSLQNALVQAGVPEELAMSSHDDEAERIFIKSQMVRNGLGTRGYWMCLDADGVKFDRKKYADEAWLDEQLKKLKLSQYVDDAEVRVGPGGQHVVYFDRASDKKLSEIGAMFIHQGSNSTHSLLNIVKGGGLITRTKGYQNHTSASGASASSDVASGGSAGTMTRFARTNSSSSGGVKGFGGASYRYCFHPRALKRADWHFQMGDSYGSQKNADTKAGLDTTCLSKKQVAGSSEILFETGLAAEDLAGMRVNSESAKKDAMKILTDEGITDVNGIPLDDFFIVSNDSASSIYAKLKKNYKAMGAEVYK